MREQARAADRDEPIVAFHQEMVRVCIRVRAFVIVGRAVPPLPCRVWPQRDLNPSYRLERADRGCSRYLRFLVFPLLNKPFCLDSVGHRWTAFA